MFSCTYGHQIGTTQPVHVQHIPHTAVRLRGERVVDQRVVAPPGDARRRIAAGRHARHIDAGALAVRPDLVVGARGAQMVEDLQLRRWHWARERRSKILFLQYYLVL